MSFFADARLAAFADETGVVPASGEHGKALRKLQDLAFDLIKVVELERSGIRDGNGHWCGSDVFGAAITDIVDHAWTIEHERYGDYENAERARMSGPEFVEPLKPRIEFGEDGYPK